MCCVLLVFIPQLERQWLTYGDSLDICPSVCPRLLTLYVIEKSVVNTVFSNKLKIPLDSRPCKLETFARPKNQLVGGKWTILNFLSQKNDKKNNQIVGQM